MSVTGSDNDFPSIDRGNISTFIGSINIFTSIALLSG